MILFSLKTPILSALALALGIGATLAGAWAFQWAGYPPCDLCLEQRYAYYGGAPIALLLALASGMKPPQALLTAGFALITALFLYNAGLAVYHSGVEAKLWLGPTACTGGAMAPSTLSLLDQLKTVKVVRCDEVGLRVLGLTLANWNVFISLALSLAAAASAVRR